MTGKAACVVGCGKMGQIHARALTDLGYAVTTVDPNGSADYCSVPHRRFDVAAIAVPITHLAECAAEWQGWGGRLLVEKPFAADALEAVLLADTLKSQRVAVGFVERFNPRVRWLREAVNTAGRDPHWAKFTRWNVRESPNVDLDLRSHDIDLARWLGLDFDMCQFDIRDRMISCQRRVTVQGSGWTATSNLMAHTESPVHAQWRAFLAGEDGPASMSDAVAVHAALGRCVERDGAVRLAA